MSDEELFRKEMGDVQPIKAKRRVPLAADSGHPEALARRRQAAVTEAEKDSNFLAGEHIPPVDPHDFLEFKRPGVQHGVYRKLRLGKYALDAQLDLHRMTVEQARQALFRFVGDCLQHDIRCALITHGKGVDRERPALLKSCVAHWLPQFAEVLAFHTAQKQHGASGATYVLLKKSEKKRRDNRERHQKR